MNLKNNIPLFYVFKFVGALGFSLPIFSLFFLSQGISFAQLSFIIILFNIANVVFEIPSGYFADIFGRKNSLIVSRLLFTIAFSVIVLINSYPAFLIGWALNGVALAFFSGADSALIYDTLKKLGRKHEFKKIQGRSFALRMAAMGIGAPVGGYFAEQFGLIVPMYMMVFVGITSFTIGLFLIEPGRGQNKPSKNLSLHFKSSFNTIKKDKVILASLLLYSSAFSMIVSSHYLFQPYLNKIGVDLKYFGIIYMLLLFSSGISAFYAHKADKFIGIKYSFLFIFILVILDFFTKAFFPLIIICVIASLINNLVFGYLNPLFFDIVNKRIRTYNRATILSIANFTSSFFIFVFNPFFGYLADKFSLFHTFFALFIVTGLFGVILLPYLFGIVNKRILE